MVARLSERSKKLLLTRQNKKQQNRQYYFSSTRQIRSLHKLMEGIFHYKFPSKAEDFNHSQKTAEFGCWNAQSLPVKVKFPFSFLLCVRDCQNVSQRFFFIFRTWFLFHHLYKIFRVVNRTYKRQGKTNPSNKFTQQ